MQGFVLASMVDYIFYIPGELITGDWNVFSFGSGRTIGWGCNNFAAPTTF